MRLTRLQIVARERTLFESVGRPVTIGRGSANDVRLDDPCVSSRHGEIRCELDAFVYHDLMSRNGSHIRRGRAVMRIDDTNGRSLRLQDGDVLLLGPLDDQPAELLVVIREREVTQPCASPLSATSITTALDFDRIAMLNRRIEDDRQSLLCIYRLLTRTASLDTLDDFQRTLVELIFELLPGAAGVELFLRRAEEDECLLTYAQQRGRPRFEIPAPPPHAPEIVEQVLSRSEAVLVEGSAPAAANRTGTGSVRSGLLVPLTGRKLVRGLLCVWNENASAPFQQRDLELMALVGSHAGLVLSNIELTGNLRTLNSELTNALRRIELLSRAKDYLGRFAPETVRRLVEESPEHPHLTALDADATILFLDIGGYTKLTEALDRDKVSFLIERYFSGFIDDIHANNGDINETAGDGLMIIFRGPDRYAHARDAVRAALAIRRKTREINAEMQGINPIDVNMGINTGMVSVGSRKIQGLTGIRWTYTATGLVTNIAARFGAHATHGQIIIGEETASRLDQELWVRDLGSVPLKNVSRPMRIFEVLDSEDTAATRPED